MPGSTTKCLTKLATWAAQWGADQELEACKRIAYERGLPDTAAEFQRIRRPKPPSLKQQALEALKKIEGNKATYFDSFIIYRALEALPND